MTIFQRFIGMLLVSTVALPSLANMPPPSLHRENAVPPSRAVTPLSDKHIVFDTCTLERADGASCTVEAGCNCGCLCVGSRTYKNPELAIVCRASGAETARIPVLLPAIRHMGLEAQGCGFVVGGTPINRVMKGLHGKSMADIFTPYTGFLGAFSPGIVNVQGGAFKNEAGVRLNMVSLEYGVLLPGVRAGRGMTQLELNPRGVFRLPGNFVGDLKIALEADRVIFQQIDVLSIMLKQAVADNNGGQEAQCSKQLMELRNQGSAVQKLLRSYIFQSSREPSIRAIEQPVQASIDPPPAGEQGGSIRGDDNGADAAIQVEQIQPPVVDQRGAVTGDSNGDMEIRIVRRKIRSAPTCNDPIVRLPHYNSN